MQVEYPDLALFRSMYAGRSLPRTINEVLPFYREQRQRVLGAMQNLEVSRPASYLTTILPDHLVSEAATGLLGAMRVDEQPEFANTGESDAEVRLRQGRLTAMEHYKVLAPMMTERIKSVLTEKDAPYIETMEGMPGVLLAYMQEPEMIEALAHVFVQRLLQTCQQHLNDVYARITSEAAEKQLEDQFSSHLREAFRLYMLDVTLSPVLHMPPDSMMMVRPGQLLLVPGKGITFVLYHGLGANPDFEQQPEERTMAFRGMNSFTRPEVLLPLGHSAVIHISYRSIEKDGDTLSKRLAEYPLQLPARSSLRAFAAMDYPNDDDFLCSILDKNCRDPLIALGIDPSMIATSAIETFGSGAPWYLDMTQGRPVCLHTDMQSNMVLHMMPLHPLFKKPPLQNS